MNLIEFKVKKQRQILAKLAENLAEMAKTGAAHDVETTLEYIQDGYLDVLGPEDFFGTEGWEHWLDLK